MISKITGGSQAATKQSPFQAHQTWIETLRQEKQFRKKYKDTSVVANVGFDNIFGHKVKTNYGQSRTSTANAMSGARSKTDGTIENNEYADSQLQPINFNPPARREEALSRQSKLRGGDINSGEGHPALSNRRHTTQSTSSAHGNKYSSFVSGKPGRQKSLVEKYREKVQNARMKNEMSFDVAIGKGVDYEDHLTKKKQCYQMGQQSMGSIPVQSHNISQLMLSLNGKEFLNGGRGVKRNGPSVKQSYENAKSKEDLKVSDYIETVRKHNPSASHKDLEAPAEFLLNWNAAVSSKKTYYGQKSGAFPVRALKSKLPKTIQHNIVPQNGRLGQIPQGQDSENGERKVPSPFKEKDNWYFDTHKEQTQLQQIRSQNRNQTVNYTAYLKKFNKRFDDTFSSLDGQTTNQTSMENPMHLEHIRDQDRGMLRFSPNKSKIGHGPPQDSGILKKPSRKDIAAFAARHSNIFS